MDAHNVEPVPRLDAGLEELDVTVSKRSEQTLVAHVAHAIQSEFSLSFLKKNWLDVDVVGLWCAAVVIEQTRHR